MLLSYSSLISLVVKIGDKKEAIIMSIRDKEEELSELEVDLEIAKKKADIAERKALEHEMKKKYGRDWKKILGWAKGIKPNKEVIEDLYIAGGKSGGNSMRDMSRPDRVKVGGRSE